VGGALLDRSALIAATTEASDAMRRRVMQMNIDHQALFAPITKWTRRVGPDDVEASVDEALATALAEMPGPVHLGLPSDIADRAGGLPAGPVKHSRTALPAPSAEALAQAAGLAAEARKPIIAAGLTAARLGLGPDLRRLAEAIGAPVVLTPMAKGLLPEDHPLYAGVLFHARSDLLADLIREADLVIGVGYDPVEFNYEAWLPQAPLVHIDTQPADVAPEVHLAVDCPGDPQTAIARLIPAEAVVSGWKAEALAAHRRRLIRALRPAASGLSPSEALEILRETLPPEGILTCDVGAHTHLIGQLWPTPSPGRLLMTNGWSSMGFAVPAALAAALCRPDLPVVGVTGDGGFTMMAGELITARRLGLNCVVMVLVDRSLSLIEVKQGWKQLDAASSRLFEGDFLQADRLFGVPVRKVNGAETLHAALRQALATEGPAVVEVEVDGRTYHELIARQYR
jgi:acetolactate synthase-1/2/3 large subunit